MSHSAILRFLAMATLFIHGNLLLAQPANVVQPTEEQLQVAKNQAEQLGGHLEKFRIGAHTLHGFRLQDATDEHLQALPSVPFSFVLDLNFSKITDAGLKDLGARTNLLALYVSIVAGIPSVEMRGDR